MKKIKTKKPKFKRKGNNTMTTKAAEVPSISPVSLVTTAYKPPVRMDTSHLPVLDVDTLPNNIFWRVLGRALTLRRDYESATESAFVAWLAKQLPVTLIDAAGNLHVDTRTDTSHRSMFTAHTDTVHSSGGPNTVHVDGKFWRATEGSALGADDGSGCALLAYMIEAGVPGYYVFFRGEECGGVGSKYLSENMPKLFKGEFDRAIAFDRAGYYDIITHQAGGRCCSNTFAEALADALSTSDSWFMPCNTGVYTDTAEFTELIPECTNVSVGYKNQHGDREEQDVEFLWDLAKTLVSVNFDALPTERDPNVRESYSRWSDWDSMGTSVYASMDGTANVKSKDGVYYGTKLFDDDDYDERRDEVECEEYTVLNAIGYFRAGSDKEWLLEMVADAAFPEDPDQAVRVLRTCRITEENLEEAEHMLMDGWGAEQVLLEIFNAAVPA